MSLKHCRICHKRGSNIKNKKNIIVLKTQNDNILQYYHDIDRICLHFDLNIGSININDIVCRKHINQMERDLMNNNCIDIIIIMFLLKILKKLIVLLKMTRNVVSLGRPKQNAQPVMFDGNHPIHG